MVPRPSPDHCRCASEDHEFALRSAWFRFSTRSAKASNVIWVGLPSRIRTIVPPGRVSSLIAAHPALPCRRTSLHRARTACSSGVAAYTETFRRPAVIAPVRNKTKCSRRIFMDPDSKPKSRSAVRQLGSSRLDESKIAEHLTPLCRHQIFGSPRARACKRCRTSASDQIRNAISLLQLTSSAVGSPPEHVETSQFRLMGLRRNADRA